MRAAVSRASSRLRVVNFRWDRGQLLEEGHTWSDELPPAGVVAQVGELPIPGHPYQVTWLLNLRGTVHDFADKSPEQHATQDVAINVVETTVRGAGHTVYGR
jgi:hypothetical protein